MSLANEQNFEKNLSYQAEALGLTQVRVTAVTFLDQSPQAMHHASDTTTNMEEVNLNKAREVAKDKLWAKLRAAKLIG